MEIAIAVLGSLVSMFSVWLAFITHKRSKEKEQMQAGHKEGLILSNIEYIKRSVDRLEENLMNVDEKYQHIAERLIKVEESIKNITKRVDNLKKGGD